MFSKTALNLQNAGADFILIASNTPHTIAEIVSDYIQIPLLHIAQVTGELLAQQRIQKVGLIDTRPTMEKKFFIQRLSDCQVESIVPEASDREIIHKAIFTELTQGIFRKQTSEQILSIIQKLKNQGAEAIIFGCTEFGLLIDTKQVSLPVFDTSEIHIRAAVKFALT